jgi:hypothetical protein
MKMDEARVTAMGHAASGLLKNPAFDAAFEQRYEQHLMDWLMTAPEETQKREHLWLSVQELLGVISIMENMQEEKDTLLASS